jgi:hypothetical protein
MVRLIFDCSVPFCFYILREKVSVALFERYADILYTTGRKAASFDEQSSRRGERASGIGPKGQRRAKVKNMSKSVRREKDRKSKVTTMVATLKNRRHGRERVSTVFSMLLNQTVSQSIKQSIEQSNQIKNQTISKKKKFTHRLRIRKPHGTQRLHLYPFLNKTIHVRWLPLPSHCLFPFQVRRRRWNYTTPHVPKKIIQPKNKKTISTTASPPVVCFPCTL